MSEASDINIERLDLLVDELVKLYRYYAYAMLTITGLVIVSIPIYMDFLPIPATVALAIVTFMLGFTVWKSSIDRDSIRKHLHQLTQTQVITQRIRFAFVYAFATLAGFFFVLFPPFLVLAVFSFLYVLYLRRLAKLSEFYADELKILKQMNDEEVALKQKKLLEDETVQAYVHRWVRNEKLMRIVIIALLAFLPLTIPYADLAEQFSTLLVFIVIVFVAVAFIVYSVRNVRMGRIRTQITEKSVSDWEVATRWSSGVTIFVFLQILALDQFAPGAVVGALFVAFTFLLITYMQWNRARKAEILEEILN
ncbi:MAG: hypothetical protein AAF787_03940 [Chloroflexota bacterium]